MLKLFKLGDEVRAKHWPPESTKIVVGFKPGLVLTNDGKSYRPSTLFLVSRGNLCLHLQNVVDRKQNVQSEKLAISVGRLIASLPVRIVQRLFGQGTSGGTS